MEQTLTTIYSLIIIVGTLTNFSLLAAFCTNKVLLTTRNILIANLAISDLLMSTTSIPLTLVDILYKYWPLGEGMVSLSNNVSFIVCHNFTQLTLYFSFVNVINKEKEFLS